VKRWYYFNAGTQEGSTVFSRVTETGTEYPWVTRREVYAQCKAAGVLAALFLTEAEAHNALVNAKVLDAKSKAPHSNQ
jgi:triphosphoribosyl-dephospho-CoA synthetase